MHQLKWRTVTSKNSPEYLVSGTMLSQAIVPLTGSRYAVVKYRLIAGDGQPGEAFAIADAFGVSDYDIREKTPAPLVCTCFNTDDEAVRWAISKSQENGT